MSRAASCSTCPTRRDPDTPAPPRFLYDFDNLLLSHADRSRVATVEAAQQNWATNIQPSMLLVDGFATGEWKLARTKESATLTVRAFARLSKKDKSAISDEGARLLEFAAPGTAHDIVYS